MSICKLLAFVNTTIFLYYVYMRRVHLYLFVIITTIVSLLAPIAHAQETTIEPDTFYLAKINAILDQGEHLSNGIRQPFQVVSATIQNGNMHGRDITIEHGTIFTIDKNRFVTNGQMVVVALTTGPQSTKLFQIVDVYRLNTLLPFLIIFVLAVILLSGWKGIGSILGMIISLLVIAAYIVPQILNGKDPLTISIIGCLVIMVTTIYLAHGFSRQTTIALAATFFTLVFTGLISVLMVKLVQLNGLGNDDAYSLKLGSQAIVNFKGLFLGGILIGALGVLDDVTTGLTASVFELAAANPKLSFYDLMHAGLRVGKEHIASLVNTLVLAYAGSSLPIFITIVINPNNYPLWSILNSEMIIEEIVRTLSGSFGLVLAVPLTTILASWYASHSQNKHM